MTRSLLRPDVLMLAGLLLSAGSPHAPAAAANRPAIGDPALDERIESLLDEGRVREALTSAEDAHQKLGDIKSTDADRIVQALYEMGRVHNLLDEYRSAQTRLSQALGLRGEGTGETDLLRAKILTEMGITCRELGNFTEAERHLNQSLRMLEQGCDGCEAARVAALGGLAEWFSDRSSVQEGDAAARSRREAARLLDEALALAQKEFGADSAQAAQLESLLAAAHVGENRIDAARPLARRALAFADSLPRERCAQRIHAAIAQAGILCAEGQTANAQRLLETALAACESAPDCGPLPIASARFALGRLLAAQSNWARAESECRKAFEIQTRLLGEWHPANAPVLEQLAEIIYKSGKLSRMLEIVGLRSKVQRIRSSAS